MDHIEIIKRAMPRLKDLCFSKNQRHLQIVQVLPWQSTSVQREGWETVNTQYQQHMSQLKQKPPVNREWLTVSCENNKNGTKGRGSSFSKLLLQTEGHARGWTLETAGISLCFFVQNANRVALMPHAPGTNLFTK